MLREYFSMRGSFSVMLNLKYVLLREYFSMLNMAASSDCQSTVVISGNEGNEFS
jgi:hypothetical protein